MPVAKRSPAHANLAPLFWSTTDGETVRLYHGNVTDVLARLPERSVQCVVTSPPYWGLRAYATGDAKHLEIGCERTPDEFVERMVQVFRGVRRVLRDDGTVWLNLGDTYGDGGNLVGVPWRVALALQADGWVLRQDVIWHKPAPMPESVRNRCTKAHEYVFLLTKSARYFYDAEAVKEKATDDIVRRVERLREKPRERHGYKQEDAVGQVATDTSNPSPNGAWHDPVKLDRLLTGSNKRSVWTVSSQGYEGAHFATFPPKLIEPMILAGTSAHGACGKCGAPWRRVTEERALTRDRPNEYVKRTGEEGTGNSCGNTVAGVESRTVGWEPTCGCFGRFEKRAGVRMKVVSGLGGHEKKAEYGNHAKGGSTLRAPAGYEEVSTKSTVYVSDLPLDQHPVVPCTVLDPFVGSGTTPATAVGHGRKGWGIDLSEKYLRENAVVRIKGALLARPALAHLVPRGVARPTTRGTDLLARPVGG